MTRKLDSKRSLTDAEEGEVQRVIASDPDSSEITDQQIKHRRAFAEAFPELAEHIKRGRGRPAPGNAKEAVTLRLDAETVARFKARGDDWRAHMAKALKDAS